MTIDSDRPPADPVAQPEARPKVWFPALDGLRAIAALLVVVFHVSGSVAKFAPPAGPRFGVEPNVWTGAEFLARLGNWGVAIFFALSGFLLYRPFVDAWFGGRPVAPVGPYLVRRLVRIIPAYWLTLSVYLFVVRDVAPSGALPYLLFYGFAQNYVTGYLDGHGALTVAWTLCIEMSFYLVLPVLALLLRLASPRRWPVAKRAAAQAGLLAASALALVLYRYWVIRAHPLQTFWLPAHFGWFAFGMAFAVWHASSLHGGTVPAVLRALGQYPWISWLFGLQVFWLTTRIVPNSFSQTRVELIEIFVGNGVSAGLLLLPLVFGDQARGWLRLALSRFPLRWLGEISYGIYLWHTVLLVWVLEWVDDGRVPGGFWPRFLVVLALTIAVAQLSLTVLERPLMDVAQARLRRRRTDGALGGAR